MMDKNINLKYETTKQMHRPSKQQPQIPNTLTTNGMDMKKIVQNYQFWLSGTIAKNQHSQVYHGIDTLTQQPVAIKAIPIIKNPTPKQSSELQNEVHLCRQFPKHKNLIPVLNTLNTTNNCYIVMERAQSDLKSLLVKKKTLDEEQVVNIMLDVLQGLRHMHLNGCMHCNVKPSNILITSTGAKLTDFALSRRINQQSKIPIDPKQWTPYMNHLTLVTYKFDQHNDAWALAVMVYECLHGYHNYPWKFENYADLLQKIYDPKIQFSRKVSKEMTDFLSKVLNPSSKLSIMDLYKEPFIKLCIQRRKQNNRQIEHLYTNGNSPLKYPSQKFGNFSANLAQCIPRQPIRSNSNQQTLHQVQQLKRHVSNHQTSQSPRKFIEEAYLEHKRLHPREIIEIEFSFMRFINIVLKQDEHGYIPEKIDPNNFDPKYLQMMAKKDIDHKLLRFVLIKQLLSQKHSLAKTIENPYRPENPFKINDLEDFLISSQGRQTACQLKNRLNEYDAKYPTLDKQMSELMDHLNKKLAKTKPEWRSRDILAQDLSRKQILPIMGVRLSREMCKHIWNQIQTGYKLLADPKTQENQAYKVKIVTMMQEKGRRVDFLITYYILNCLLVDNFSDPEYFVRHSGLKVIMNNKPGKLELEHFKLIEEKLRALQII